MGRVAELAGTAKCPLTREQKADIATRFLGIVPRLPSQAGIQHSGPSVVARAAIECLRASNMDEWRTLADEARRVPNTSDRCLVLLTIADLLAKRDLQFRDSLVEEAIQIADSIPSLLDRCDRLLNIADVFSNRTRQLARRAVRLAAQACAARSDSTADDARRRVLDIAHSIDESLVPAMIAIMDPDPARSEVRQSERAASRRKLDSAARVLSFRKALGAPREIDEGVLESTRKAEICTACRGAIASLNAGLRQPVAIDDQARQMLGKVSTLSLRRAYWAYAWATTNSARRSAGGAGNLQVTRMFDAILRSADVASSFGSRLSQRRSSIVHDEISAGVVIDAGERAKAFQFIRAWLEKNAPSTITLCDPYFCADDLDFVALIGNCIPSARITVLTSRKEQLKEGPPAMWRGVYSRAWCELSDQEPPNTDIVVCGDDDVGAAPFHDRWLLADTAGLVLGTSSRSLGLGKLSRVGELGREEFDATSIKLSGFLSRANRVHNGRRLIYDVFTVERGAD